VEEMVLCGSPLQLSEWNKIKGEIKCNNMSAHLSKMKRRCFTVTTIGLLLLSVIFLSVTKMVCVLVVYKSHLL